MAYLIEDDFSLRIGISNLNEILIQAANQTTTPLLPAQILTNAITWAQTEATSYLIQQYDIQTEFAKVNTDITRNFQIVAAVIDIALYTLHKTVNPRDVPEHIEKGYEQAIKFLEQARDAKIILALLPPRDTQNQTGQTDEHFPETFISGQVKFVSKQYQEARLYDKSINPLLYDVPGSGVQSNQNQQNANLTLGILAAGSNYVNGAYTIQLNVLSGTVPQTPCFCTVTVQSGVISQVKYTSGGLGADLTTVFNYAYTLGGTGSGLQISVTGN